MKEEAIQRMLRSYRRHKEKQLALAVLIAVVSFLAGFIIGQIRGYDRGAADQARLDALVSPEGQEHLRRELQKVATNPPAVLIPK